MNGLMKKTALTVALAATAATAAVPATAQRFHGGGGFHGGGFHGGGFRGGGFRGGGWGHGWRGGGWGRGGLGYGGAAVLGGLVGLGVGAAIADRGPYYGGYYGAPAYGYYGPRCWRQWRWDPYWGRNVPVRVCN